MTLPIEKRKKITLPSQKVCGGKTAKGRQNLWPSRLSRLWRRISDSQDGWDSLLGGDRYIRSCKVKDLEAQKPSGWLFPLMRCRIYGVYNGFLYPRDAITLRVSSAAGVYSSCEKNPNLCSWKCALYMRRTLVW